MEYLCPINDGSLDVLIERWKHVLRGLSEYHLRTDNEFDRRLARLVFEAGHRAFCHVKESGHIGLGKAPLFAQGVKIAWKKTRHKL